MTNVPKDCCCGCDLKCGGVFIGIIFFLIGAIYIAIGASNSSRYTSTINSLILYPLIIDGALFIIGGILTLVMVCQERKNPYLSGFMYYYTAFRFICLTILCIVFLITSCVYIGDSEEGYIYIAIIYSDIMLLFVFLENFFVVRYFYIFYRNALQNEKGDMENMNSPYNPSAYLGVVNPVNPKEEIDKNTELAQVNNFTGRN
jgi:hypothetical protein